jgi:hypothetical protein
MTRTLHSMRQGAAIGILLIGVAAIDVRADKVTIDATVILASNSDGQTDSRLSAIAPKLKKIFGFRSYKHFGGGSTTIGQSGRGTVKLGGGGRLAIKAAPAKTGKIRLGLQWDRGGATLIKTTVVKRRGETIILGGAPHGGGKLIIHIVLH